MHSRSRRWAFVAIFTLAAGAFAQPVRPLPTIPQPQTPSTFARMQPPDTPVPMPLGVPMTPGTPGPTTEPPGTTAPEPLTNPNPPLPQAPSPADGSVEFPQPPPEAPFDWTKFRLGGQFRVEPNFSNYPFHPLSILAGQPRQGFVNQRYRLWGTYTPNDNVEGYIQMQVGGINYGTNYDFNKNFGGNFATLPGDRLGIELRRAWLALKDDELGKLRIGFLDWHDSFGDTLASADYDFNVGGIDYTRTVKEWNNFRLSLAGLLLADRAFLSSANNPATPPAAAGTATAYLFALDVDQPIGKKLSVGASAYYVYDRGGYSYPTAPPTSYSQSLWTGVRAKWNNEVMPLGGFFIVNTGSRENLDGQGGASHTGFAFRTEAGPLKIGCGRLSAQFIYSSGGDGNGGGSEFRTVAQSYRDNFGAQGYWSYLQIATPNAPGDVNDLGVGLQNRGLGLVTVQAKYEYPLTKRLLSTTAAGYLQADRPSPINGSRVMGTELGEMFTYDFGGGLKLDTGVATLFTGDFYRPAVGDKLNTLYEVFTRLQLEF